MKFNPFVTEAAHGRGATLTVPTGALPFTLEEDLAARTVTVRLRNDGVPSFTIPILEAMDALFTRWRTDGVAADTLIFTSDTPATFSMGGDLATIAALSRSGDDATLRAYAHVSARVVHALWNGLGCDTVTVGAVDGKAFGSGFEAITACHIAVAGVGATFAFPEARFGLFPGMGATSLLGRRVSPAAAEALILSGRKLSAAEALAIGAIDKVTDEGESAEHWALHAVAARTDAAARLRENAKAGRRRQHYSLREAIDVVDVWVASALALPDTRIGEIERIARMQKGRSGKRKETTSGYQGLTNGARP